MAKAIKASERAQLKTVKRELRWHGGRKREAMRRAVALCKARRRELVAYRKERRAEVRAALNAEFEALKCSARKACSARKDRVRRGAATAIRGAQKAVEEERRFLRHLKSLERRKKKKQERLTSKVERRRESADEVRANLPEELHLVWEKMRRWIPAAPVGKSTEAFLEWAEANPGDVVAMQQEYAEREVRALLREQERLERQARKRPKPTRANLRQAVERDLRALGAPEPKKLALRLVKGHDDAEARRMAKAFPRKAPALRAALANVDELRKAVPF